MELLRSLHLLLIRIGPAKAVDLAEAEPDRAISVVLLLQRVLREAIGHVDVAHGDAVLAGVADDLRRRIEAHRLRIEQSAAERVGMIMLQPGRDIDQLRETGRMAFRKAIGAKAFDLVETALGEVRLITA